ncbi:hypothetical protein Pan44_28370 [Caulifigura coniformis]|uniref:Uncharacterized protein n=1 Tax=Caulifigura coniformis TaxID=2527983 RepID=A0A517SFA0_9PLAN|nr:hypothetical protein Pan44_28370 [Caulifigura coniformis]
MTSPPSPPNRRRRRIVVTLAVVAVGLCWLFYEAVRVSNEVGIVAPGAIPRTEGSLASLFDGHAVFFERYYSSHNLAGHLTVFGRSSPSRFEAFAFQAGLDHRPDGGNALNHSLTDGITAFLNEDDPTFAGELNLSSDRRMYVEAALHRDSGETVVRCKF